MWAQNSYCLMWVFCEWDNEIKAQKFVPQHTFNWGIKWVISRNSNVSFCFDTWTFEGPIYQMIQGPLSLEDQ